MSDEEPVLPDRPNDETDVGWGEDPDPEDRLHQDVPPHHVDRD